MSDKKQNNNSKKGFASNPQNINRSGRPKGSRNKKSLVKAQLELDDLSLLSTGLLKDLVTNNKENLGITSDVPLSLRFNAAKEALTKAIANEKDKGDIDESHDNTDTKEPEEVAPKVVFSLSAK